MWSNRWLFVMECPEKEGEELSDRTSIEKVKFHFFAKKEKKINMKHEE